jgi:hypothetical protein
MSTHTQHSNADENHDPATPTPEEVALACAQFFSAHHLGAPTQWEELHAHTPEDELAGESEHDEDNLQS